MAGMSRVMREALAAAAERPLLRRRNGWTADGVRGFQTATVWALSGRGFLKVDPLAADGPCRAEGCRW